MITTAWRTVPSATELEDVRALADTVAAADGTAAFASPAMRDLADWAAAGSAVGSARPTSRGLLALDDGRLAGYAHVDAASADDVVELAVHPDHRRHGVGAALADVLAAELPTGRAWAHGDHPGAARLAERAGRRRARELWRMRRPPSAGPLPELGAPAGTAVRALRVGTDEQAVVAVNNRAFAWHPEQSGWTVDEVRRLEAESWFDPEGVLLAWDEVDGDLLGFHWTKVHARSPSVPDPLGEVYVVGVDPSAQGRGLGAALTLAGLHHLAGRGLDTVFLYVEGDNAAAVVTYRRLGFERDAIDVSYQP